MSLVRMANKRAIFAVIFLMVVFVSGVFIFYFRFQNSQLDSKFKALKSNYDDLSKQNNQLKDNAARKEGDYAKLKNDFDAISSDRENMRIQIKGLLGDRALARELEAKVDKNKQDIDSLDKNKQDLLEANTNLKGTIKKLEALYEKTVKEKDTVVTALAKERDTSLLKRVEKEKDDLNRENDKLNDNLKAAAVKLHVSETDADKLKKELDKSRQETAELNAKLDRFNKNYDEAVQKNKALEQKVVEEPKKFAEIARQNKVLMKQTANMHYNLGVFYTKQKEYTRAIAEFEKAVELNPNDAYSHFNLGYIYAEYIVDRPKAIEHFRHYLRNAKADDKDVDWVKTYLLTWESWDGNKPVE